MEDRRSETRSGRWYDVGEDRPGGAAIGHIARVPPRALVELVWIRWSRSEHSRTLIHTQMCIGIQSAHRPLPRLSYLRRAAVKWGPTLSRERKTRAFPSGRSRGLRVLKSRGPDLGPDTGREGTDPETASGAFLAKLLLKPRGVSGRDPLAHSPPPFLRGHRPQKEACSSYGQTALLLGAQKAAASGARVRGGQ